MRDSGCTICLTRPPYSEFFLRTFANDGILPYKLKSISIGFTLYALGLGITFFSGTLGLFLTDIGFVASSILVGIIICAVIGVCKQIDPTLKEIDRISEHSKHEKFHRFVDKWNNEPVWLVKERYWYHFHTLSLSILLALWSYCGIIGNYGWVVQTNSNHLYYIFWSAVVGYIAGVAVNRFGNYTFLIDEYCRDFLDPEKFNFISPKTRIAFKPLGKLALKADLTLAIPTVVILIHSLVWWTQQAILPFSKPWHLFMTIAYISTLVFVFFFPLRNAHLCMVKGKKKAIERVDENLSALLNDATQKADALAAVGGLISIREGLNKMNTWPLDPKSSVGAITIFLLPVLTGAVIQLFLEYVLSGGFR